MDLFRRIAIFIAEKLGYSYPTEIDKQVTEWTRTHLTKDEHVMRFRSWPYSNRRENSDNLNRGQNLTPMSYVLLVAVTEMANQTVET